MAPLWQGAPSRDKGAIRSGQGGLSLVRRLRTDTPRIGTRPRAWRGPRRARWCRPQGLFAVESYLDHHADKLARRFDANTYLRMIHAVNSHDVGRGRGGLTAALSDYRGDALVVAIDSDRLYPLSNAERLAAALPGDVDVTVLHSDIGHDGFLVEGSGLNDAVTGLLRRVAVGA